MKTLNEKRKAAGYKPIPGRFPTPPSPRSQFMLVYYWRPTCSCGWESERIFHLGEERESNSAFDQHACQGETKFATKPKQTSFDRNSLEMKRILAAPESYLNKGLKNLLDNSENV